MYDMDSVKFLFSKLKKKKIHKQVPLHWEMFWMNIELLHL